MASLVTRCPACSTLFKVVPDQLRISEGWVRCGQCDEVFDAQAQMQPQVVLAPDVAPVQAAGTSYAATQPQASAIDAEAPLAPDVVIDGMSASGVQALATSATAGTDLAGATVPPEGCEAAGVATEQMLPWAETVFTEPPVQTPQEEDVEDARVVPASFLRPMPRAKSSRVPWLLPLLVLLLGLVLAGQILIQQRDRIAATEPALTVALNTLCQPIGCQVAPLQQIESIVIESSSFIKVRADVYRLSFSIKNTALVPLALPSAELALTDLRDQSVLRRVLSPTEYGARIATLGQGEELTVVVPVAVKALSATSEKVTGYRLLVFYP